MKIDLIFKRAWHYRSNKIEAASLVIVGPRPEDENRTTSLPIHNMTKKELLGIVGQSTEDEEMLNFIRQRIT